MRQKGDILEATKRGRDAGKHYIVFYEGCDDKHFIGGMVTHSNSKKNVAMSESHFVKTDSNGDSYKFQFDDTHLVKAKLMKLEEWGPFSKIGKLSDKGIQFVEATIGHLHRETWEEYLDRTQ